MEKSNIFNNNIKGKEHIPRNKAEELALEILSILDIKEFNTNSKLIVNQLGSKGSYNRKIEALISREVLGNYEYRYSVIDNSVSHRFIFVNLVEVEKQLDTKEYDNLFKDLVVPPNKTNLFIYVLLHEIGHYEHINKLVKNNLIKTSEKMKSLMYLEELTDAGYVLISPYELYADLYAHKSIRYVIENINNKFKNYLD